MINVETAKTLSLVGAILSIVFGAVYILFGMTQVAIFYNTYNGYWYGSSYWTLLGLSFVIYGIISLILGILTLAVARKCLVDASTLKTGAIMCFIFGGISVAAIGGILTIVAGVLAIIAWDEERKAAEASPKPPLPQVPSTAAIFCKYCGASEPPEATFCSSCGKRLKK
jgi:vacuolar-type H+-ATPase subunit I/STV1